MSIETRDLSSKKDLLRLRSELTQRYDEREIRGAHVINQGLVVKNPNINGEKVDSRYSIAAIGRIIGSVNTFLKEVIEKIMEVEPDINFVPDGFRHLTFREISFNQKGRKKASMSSETVLNYYKALREENFTMGPVRLELYKIIASVDIEQPSVSIIACLLPEDSTIVNVRNGVSSAISKAGLPLIGRLGDIQSTHVTLARMPNPPRRDGNNVPLLDIIDEINSSIPEDCRTEIKDIDVISTTPISYVDVSKHVHIWPPVSLIGEQSQDPIRYLRPKQRLQK